MLEICALASGSNGNCYYIGNEKDAILIDAGIFYKRLVERMNDAKLDISKIRAVYISHEHNDHVMGVRVICKKLNIPAYFTEKTFKYLSYNQRPPYARYFTAGETRITGDFTIHTFAKLHDAADPCSFRIEYNGINIAVLTDVGVVDEQVLREFSKCQVVFLETNYDKDMLWNGSYPIFIKKRVDSDVGHLSNIQALELVKNHASPELKYIFLSHISQENNTIDIVSAAFSELMDKYTIIPTSREGISEVLKL